MLSHRQCCMSQQHVHMSGGQPFNKPLSCFSTGCPRLFPGAGESARVQQEGPHHPEGHVGPQGQVGDRGSGNTDKMRLAESSCHQSVCMYECIVDVGVGMNPMCVDSSCRKSFVNKRRAALVVQTYWRAYRVRKIFRKVTYVTLDSQ